MTKDEFGAYYMTIYPGLVGLATGLLKDRDKAEEVVATVLEHFIVHPQDLDATKNPKSYLEDRVHRHIIRYYTKNQANAGREEFNRVSVEEADREGVEHPFKQIEQHVDLERAMEHLTPKQRRAVYLRYWKGMEPSEIAAYVGMARQSVHELLNRAEDRLRAVLGEDYAHTQPPASDDRTRLATG